MTNGFDVMTVWIKHDGAVVVGMVVRPQAGRAIVFSSGGKSGTVKIVNQSTANHSECNMHGRSIGTAFDNPEVGLWGLAETSNIAQPVTDAGNFKRSEYPIEDRALL